MIQNAATDLTVDAMNLRARRVFTETLMLVKETERLEAAGREADAEIVHGPLSMIAELISTHLGEDIPDDDPSKSDMQHIRHMLWHVDDGGLSQIRSFLAARVPNNLPLDPSVMPPPMSETAIREALGLGARSIDELEMIWDNLASDARAALLGWARELHDGASSPNAEVHRGHSSKATVAERRRAESNLSDQPDVREIGEVLIDDQTIGVESRVHTSGVVDVIVRIGTPRAGKA